jgi:hypothetical protein
MAVQIIPGTPSFGELLGTSAARGLSTGLEQLAQRKLKSLEQRNQGEAFKKLGLPEELSQIPEQSALKFMEQFLQSGAGGLSQDGQSGSLQEALQSISQQPSKQVINQQETQQASEQQQESDISPEIKAQRDQLKKLTPAQRIQQANAQKEARKIAHEEQKLADKETKPYYDAVIKGEKGAKENDLRLDRIENLVNKGSLPNAGLWTFLTKIEDSGTFSPAAAGGAIGAALGSVVPGAGTAIGGAIGGVLGSMAAPLAGAAKSIIRSGSPDIEEFEKLSADFVKNAKQYFGARLTDADLKAYMQTVPNLMQTDAGKKKVIENLRSINEIARKEAKAARDIIRANNGKRPFDLEQQVQDLISDELDKLAQKFIVR